jgi:cytochrome c-type protein NapB
MSHASLVVAAALLLTACSTTRGPAPAAAPPRPVAAPVADRDLGLSKTSVFDVPSPPAWKDETAGPGEKPLPPRISSEIPPVIPHGVGDFLPITRTLNACVDCHVTDHPKKAGDPTPVPASHFVDLRRAPDRTSDKLAGTRWVCTACHTARTDAPPAVGSRYRP